MSDKFEITEVDQPTRTRLTVSPDNAEDFDPSKSSADDRVHVFYRYVSNAAVAICGHVAQYDQLTKSEQGDFGFQHCVSLLSKAIARGVNTHDMHETDVPERLRSLVADFIANTARSAPPVPETSPTSADLRLIGALSVLCKQVAAHNQRAAMGEPVDWAALTDALSQAARSRRQHVLAELGPLGGVGDSGSH